VPDPKGSTETGIDDAYVGTEYDFGISPLFVPDGSKSTLESVALTGLSAGVSVRIVAVARSTSPSTLTSGVGDPAKQDPARFKLLPVKGLVVENREGVEDHYLIVIMKVNRVGRYRASGVDVVFRQGESRDLRHYRYALQLEVTHAEGRDERLDLTPLARQTSHGP
jgi:hypothetical protein